MTSPGYATSPDRRLLCALAALGLGVHTRGPRVVAQLRRVHELSEEWLDVVLAAMAVPPSEFSSCRAEAYAAADLALGGAASRGFSSLTTFDGGYPPRLAQVADPPIVLWTDGPGRLEDSVVAVVGSRRATPGGLAMAERLGYELAQAGVGVVSGLARGIDAAAHRGALRGGGATIAILGSGLDVMYPPEHRELADAITAGGGLVASEFFPGTPPLPRHFPLRNRIISGLCRAVVVVEASDKSGSLITARMALEQGREVLAVPGGVASGAYKGCHGLIKDGARLVETVEDVLDELRWPRRDLSLVQKSSRMNDLSDAIAPGAAVTVEQLAAETGRQAADLLAELGVLELAGRIARLPGGTYVRLD